jgi:hypothetical protein
MSDEPDFTDPLAVLKGFISEMNRWERDAWRLSREARATSDPASWQAPVAEHKARIFAKYCSPRHHKFSDVGGFSKPPTYDPETEQLLEVTPEGPGRVTVFTQQPGAGSVARKCQYVLVKKDGRWWIDSKKEFDHAGKPRRVTL